MFEQVAKLSDEVVAATEKKRWTWRRFVRTALLAVPAYLTIIVHCAEDVWSKHYDDAATRTPDRRQARLWACTWGVLFTVAICVVWYFSAVTSLLYRGTFHFQIGSLPHPTEWMLFVGSHGWLLLLPVPLVCWALMRLRLRGGIYQWYSELICGMICLGLVFLACAICCGAAIPFIDWSAQYRIVE